MTISKSIKLKLTTILLLVLSINSFSQKLEPKVRYQEPDHTITSKIMGKEYQIYLSFPVSYSTKDSISYPVLYVLDGAYFYPTFNQVNRRLSARGLIEDVIIVGISSGEDWKSWFMNRNYDYTISSDTLDDRITEKEFDFPKGSLNSGGGVDFLKCIKTEIVPFIDKHYKTNTDRGISGHSLGGLFSAYCFINSDGYFTRFGINSASLWWKKEEVLDQAVLQFMTNETWNIPQSKVFISVGEKEDARMVSPMVKLSSYLEEANYENIDLNWQIFEDESHLTAISANSSRTLTVLFGKK